MTRNERTRRLVERARRLADSERTWRALWTLGILATEHRVRSLPLDVIMRWDEVFGAVERHHEQEG